MTDDIDFSGITLDMTGLVPKLGSDAQLADDLWDNFIQARVTALVRQLIASSPNPTATGSLR